MAPRIGTSPKALVVTQPTVRSAPALAQSEVPARRESSFEVAPKKPKVVLAPELPPLPPQTKEGMVKQIHAFLQQAATSQPPLSEEALVAGFKASLRGKAGLPEQTQDALRDLARGAIQLGRARLQASQGQLELAADYLDQPEQVGGTDDAYGGALVYRDRALASGALTQADVGPLAVAIRDVTGSTLGALGPQQAQLNQDAAAMLKEAGAYKDFLESKNFVLSQSQLKQVPANDLVQQYGQLERALQLPLTDPTRDDTIRGLLTSMRSNISQLGSIQTLDENRLAASEGLEKLGSLIGSIPTPPTRLLGGSLKQVSATLQWAANDISNDQYALKTVSNVLDVAGGNLGDKLTGSVKVLAEVGFDFMKTLTDELSKVDQKADGETKSREQLKACANAAYTTAVNQLRAKLGGEVPERVIQGVARTFVSAVTSAVSDGAWDALTNPKLTPQQRSARLRDITFKAAGEAVKSLGEFFKQ